MKLQANEYSTKEESRFVKKRKDKKRKKKKKVKRTFFLVKINAAGMLNLLSFTNSLSLHLQKSCEIVNIL
jgi:hypothetical protein